MVSSLHLSFFSFLSLDPPLLPFVANPCGALAAARKRTTRLRTELVDLLVEGFRAWFSTNITCCSFAFCVFHLEDSCQTLSLAKPCLPVAEVLDGAAFLWNKPCLHLIKTSHPCTCHKGWSGTQICVQANRDGWH